MKRPVFLIIILIVLLSVDLYAQLGDSKIFSAELSIGPRMPVGLTKDDITTGIGFEAGVGYNLNPFFELLHLALDFGNSAPHDPNTIVVQDYYSYYGRLAMETVTIYGFPLTTRFHFPLRNNISGFMGAGVSYYWYSSRLDDPLYGSLQEPRKRHGFGPVFEGGLVTNFFSERWLLVLEGDLVYLDTNGKSLSVKEGKDPTVRVSRKDKYLSIYLGVRYALGRQTRRIN